MGLTPDTRLDLYALDEKPRAKRPISEPKFTFEGIDDCLRTAVEHRRHELYSIRTLADGSRQLKKRKMEHLAPIVWVTFNTRVNNGKPKLITLKGLLDSGASGSLIKEKFCKKLKIKGNQTATFETAAGRISSKGDVNARFALPEMDPNMVLEWKLHIAQNLGSYDMIIGRDLLTDLGITLDFGGQCSHYQHVQVPMKPVDGTVETAYHVQEPATVEEATSRVTKILDAHYEKADLSKVCEECSHLTPEEREALLALLRRYEPLFDGTLGKWTGDPYGIELKPDAKPYHARPYPIPKIHKPTLLKERG